MNNNFSLDIRDYTLAAGGRLELHTFSDFFQIMEATSPVTINFLNKSAVVGVAENVGQGFRINVKDGFSGVVLTSAVAQTIKLCFATGGNADLSQVVSVTGTVSVINGELERVRSGNAFAVAGYSGAVAGAYSTIQLLNPAGSGVNALLNKMTLMAAVAGAYVSVRPYDTPLITLGQAGLSKKLGGAVGKSVTRSEAPLGLLGTDTIMTAGLETAFNSTEVPFSEPLMLEPGRGIIVLSNIVNAGIWASFQWQEETI